MKHKNEDLRNTRLNTDDSEIIVPQTSVFRPASPHERRMLRHPYRHIPKGPPQESLDLAVRLRAREVADLHPAWLFARTHSGSGFLMSTVLRTFLLECYNRLVHHGPHSFPVSFNVLESFLVLDRKVSLVYDLRPEKEHLLDLDDYFEWYANDRPECDPQVLVDIMDEGVVYSYDMTSVADGYRVSGVKSKIVVAGVSLVRHEDELSCFLVAGENPGCPPDDKVDRMLEAMSPTSGKEAISPSKSLSVKNRYLDRFPGFVRVHLLTRFNLSAASYSVRYINIDLGAAFNVITDDPVATRGGVTELDKKLMGNYRSLYSALASLIYLPMMFVDEKEHTSTLTVKTKFFAERNSKLAKEAIREFTPPAHSFERVVRRLSTRQRSKSDSTSIVPPEFNVEKNGYWRGLAPGEFGKDQDGNHVVGRTWVARHDSWSASDPSAFLVERSPRTARGIDPGIVYVARNPANVANVYKVGLTRRTSKERASDLSKTSAPVPFLIVGEWSVGNCREVEKQVHKILKRYRLNPKREFFQCEVSRIFSAVERVIKKLEN